MNTILQGVMQFDKKERYIANTTSTEYNDIVELMTDKGLLPDNSIEDENLRARKQKLRKNAYHNTILLLKHYRMIAWLLECFPEDIAAELDKPFNGVDQLIESFDVESGWNSKKLESRMKTIEKTRLLMDRVNEALSVLKKMPEEGYRLYKLIYFTYISPEKLSHNEILYRLGLSSRHYYRLRNEAVSVMSVRLWAATKADIDVWLEMISLLETIA